MSFANKIFKRNKPKEDFVSASVIGKPTNVNHDIHVIKNEETGQLEGLPSAWIRQIGNQISKDEQSRDPTAVYMAVKYYNYSIKKNEGGGEVIKHIMTEDDIDEESKQIDNFMNSKDAHKSHDLLDDEEIDRHLNVMPDLPSLSNR